ncbi:MAG: carotenoid biosynthesis protein [Deltaproteobacteria bacterium]|nr:MAG: carotenoid biosynthesis protein [Deltaproteobacteria bacterium]
MPSKEILLTTLLHRPYVFAFLISFLIIGFLNRGILRTFLFLTLGTTIAFLSEYSSIRNGFPYGMYHYLPEAMKGEWIVGGVPVWDSLSYSFLAYAAYETASYFYPTQDKSGWHLPILSSLLMVMIDIVVDPLAVRGGRWFLGEIFYYPTGGLYFGVPLTNFAGWLLVALCIFSSYHFIEQKIFSKPPPQRRPQLGVQFYWGILIFNFIITFWLREWVLGATGLGMQLLSIGVLKLFSKKSTDS